MHVGELAVDVGLVRRLLAGQFPRWADLDLTPVASTGTVNALFRLGDELVVRLPRVPWGVSDVAKEHRWLPRLAPLLPVPVPEVLGRGEPADHYPWPWSVCRWLDGQPPRTGGEALARDLAGFLAALHRADPEGAPDAHRGGPLRDLDAPTREAIRALRGEIDADAATAVWEQALAAPAWTGAPVWVHADLMPGNLLTSGDRLAAVIDFGTAGVGDPACDLIAAWYLLTPSAREAFRAALAPDEATWTRGRGRALSMALIQLPYYRDTNPAIAAQARRAIRESTAPES
ncbi:aminoglycoside phosphotransferase (APT) family kinase protein [Saccharothrix coeruleofusca]|uniref:aminoglycoside phosphotransferase family protein n=1 Tax=Saccharothrix coeruleofusca TaxID=33919 RepID=UPI001AE7FA11|nr:aminoglycoside phosphotransferase family protein [Saccharothrix coeruleofusca]MBP2340858.1 aminoglycoside phosphotransferase (APT) family kinase protein [Saccharothrix coeruleofusca]